MAKILELADSNQQFNIDNDPRINIEELTKDDDNPMFVNVEVIRTGVSKINRRVYENPIVEQIGQMIPGTLGYLGHPDPHKTSFQFRDPQCIYVGARVDEMGDIKRAIGKAYIFKSSPLREWIPKSIIGGSPLTVSINGTGDVIRDIGNNLMHVRSMTELQSIDWANPGTEGVGSAQAINIVHEMQGEEGGSKMDNINIKSPEVIRSITLAEMKAYNEDVLNTNIQGITIAELQAKNPNLYDEVRKSGAITEVSVKVDGKEQSVKLTEMQGILDQKDATIAELQNSINEMKITEYKNEKLADIPEKFRESISKRVTGTTKEEINASIDSEVAYIKEMMGDSFDNPPIINNPPRGAGARQDTNNDHKAIMDLFGVKTDNK